MPLKNIMLIDDDDIFNMLSGIALKKVFNDLNLLVFTSANAAIDYFEENIGEQDKIPEVIFLDINMPVMNGFEFLDHISNFPVEVLNRIKVVMLTSSMYETDKDKSLAYPLVKHYLEKPLTIQKVNDLKLYGQ